MLVKKKKYQKMLKLIPRETVQKKKKSTTGLNVTYHITFKFLIL